MPPLPDCGLIVRGKVIATARIRCASGFSRSSSCHHETGA